MRNPTWTRDELIVALDFYLKHRPQIPGKASSEIAELSKTLNQMGEKILASKSDTFRNPSGVYMKLMNFRRFDPDYTGAGLERGGKDEEVVWKLFAEKPKVLSQVAQAIADFTTGPEEDALQTPVSVNQEEVDAPEGNILTQVHKVRERSAKLVKKKKEQALSREGKLACECCGFDFSSKYGELGDGFIECHHTKPVSELLPKSRTKLSDLALVCSNCHRMIHRKRPWLGIDQLKSLLR